MNKYVFSLHFDGTESNMPMGRTDFMNAPPTVTISTVAGARTPLSTSVLAEPFSVTDMRIAMDSTQ